MIQDFVPIVGGPLKAEDGKLVFEGGKIEDQNQPSGQQQQQVRMGLYLTKEVFSGGTISSKFTFTTKDTACAEIVLFYNPQTFETVDAGIPPDYTFLCVRAFENGKWTYIRSIGERARAITPGKEYHVEVSVAGSMVTVACDGVEAIKTVLPKQYPPSQVGLFLLGEHNIIVSEFKIVLRRPRTFVICQFSSPYNEVYLDVIKKVCDEKDIDVEVRRADEVYGSGLIISDVVRDINDSSFVIADISPVNANVFYELGYAHGVNKPAILIAERSTKLPFDVSPFRTLFYDNTIGGKAKLEQGLRESILAVLGKER